MALSATAVLAVPGAAAAQVLTDSEGPVELGGTILVKSTNALITTPIGNIQCATIAFDLEVIANGEVAEAEGPGEAGPCTFLDAEKTKVTVTSMTVGNFTLDGEGGGSVSLKYTSDYAIPPFFPECTFFTDPSSGKEVLASYESGVESDTVEIAGLLAGEGTTCPVPEWGSAIEGEFTLETENGDPIRLK